MSKREYIATGIPSFDDLSLLCLSDKSLEEQVERTGLMYSPKVDWGEITPVFYMEADEPSQVRQTIINNRCLLQRAFGIIIDPILIRINLADKGYQFQD